jgi:hypothetical protein
MSQHRLAAALCAGIALSNAARCAQPALVAIAFVFALAAPASRLPLGALASSCVHLRG